MTFLLVSGYGAIGTANASCDSGKSDYYDLWTS